MVRCKIIHSFGVEKLLITCFQESWIIIFFMKSSRLFSMRKKVFLILYFRLLVFGILVILVAWFSFYFFPSCPSCLAKCKQRLCNIFLYSHNLVIKSNQKPKVKNGTIKTIIYKKEPKYIIVHLTKNYFTALLKKCSILKIHGKLLGFFSKCMYFLM